jgi:hypothetical protein
MLQVFAVLGDHGGLELDKLAPELGDELGPHEVLDGLLLLGVGVDVDVELLPRLSVTRCSKHCATGSTYHKLVLTELVRDFGHCDGARNVIILGSGAWPSEF